MGWVALEIWVAHLPTPAGNRRGSRPIPRKLSRSSPVAVVLPHPGYSAIPQSSQNPTAPLWMTSGFSPESSQSPAGFLLSDLADQICRLGELAPKDEAFERLMTEER